MGNSSFAPADSLPRQVIEAFEHDDPEAFGALLRRDRLWRHYQCLLCLRSRRLPDGVLQLVCSFIPDHSPAELEIRLERCDVPEESWSMGGLIGRGDDDRWALGGLPVAGAACTSQGEQYRPLEPQFKWLASHSLRLNSTSGQRITGMYKRPRDISLPELAWGVIVPSPLLACPGCSRDLQHPKILEWLENHALSAEQLAAWKDRRQQLEYEFDKGEVYHRLEGYVVDKYTSR